MILGYSVCTFDEERIIMLDRDIIKAYADLEGVEVERFCNQWFYDNGEKVFHPICDGALTWKAMVKYEVFVDYIRKECVMYYSVKADDMIVVPFVEGKIPHAILKCILKSELLWIE